MRMLENVPHDQQINLAASRCDRWRGSRSQPLLNHLNAGPGLVNTEIGLGIEAPRRRESALAHSAQQRVVLETDSAHYRVGRKLRQGCKLVGNEVEVPFRLVVGYPIHSRPQLSRRHRLSGLYEPASIAKLEQHRKGRLGFG